MTFKPYLSPALRLAERVSASRQLPCRRHISCSSTRLTSSPYQSATRHVSEDKSPYWNIIKREVTDNEEHKKFQDDMEADAESLRGFLLPARYPKLPPDVEAEVASLRLPRAAQLNYLDPLRRKPQGKLVDAASLQLRSYSARNLELSADFAMRAAYYLNLPALGPKPLPRLVERWTVPKSHFIFKKSQENFERVTVRREIRIVNSHPKAVAVWLAFVRKHAPHGVGFKANVFEYGGLDVEGEMDARADEFGRELDERLEFFGARKDVIDGYERTGAGIVDPALGAESGNLGPMGSAAYLKKSV